MPEATNDEIPTYTDVPVGIDAQGRVASSTVSDLSTSPRIVTGALRRSVR